jgi:hypothetical protein
MFPSGDRSIRRRLRAVTLIEAVLYISIALALIVGGLVFFQQANTAARTSSTIRQLSALVAETRVLIKGQPLNTVLSANVFATDALDITSYLISAGAVGGDMVSSPTTLRNVFGGTVSVTAGRFGPNDLILISVTGIPPSVCTRLLTGSRDGANTANTAVATGQQMYATSTDTIMPGFSVWPLNAKQAGVSCNFGSLPHINVGIDGTPATPRIQGNVDVMMFFRVDA